MPHDANGKVLAVGDKVHIPATVKAVHMAEDYCNLDLEFDLIMPGRDSKDQYHAINTRQVVKTEN